LDRQTGWETERRRINNTNDITQIVENATKVACFTFWRKTAPRSFFALASLINCQKASRVGQKTQNTCGPNNQRPSPFDRKEVSKIFKHKRPKRTGTHTGTTSIPTHTLTQRKLLPFCSILLCAPLFMRLVNLVFSASSVLLLFSHFPADCRQHISQIAVKVLRKLTRFGAKRDRNELGKLQNSISVWCGIVRFASSNCRQFGTMNC